MGTETKIDKPAPKGANDAFRKSMKYFDDDRKYATYIGAAIIVIFSLALGLALGKYRVILPYVVPSGNGTRISGSTWTLFNQPWILPHTSSASLTDTIIGLGIVFALIPVIYVTYNNFRFVKSVERNIPRFLRDILESTDSGVTLPAALIRASTSDYGPISREIGISMTKFSLGYDFRDSVMESCKKLKHPFMIQVGLIIVEAYSSGGRTHDVLNSSVILFNGLEQYTEEKQSELRPYTQLVYISIIIFLIIAFIITAQFIGPLDKLPITATSPSGLSAGGHASINLS
ncbi:MAG: type II secretion system F family protein, partial [Thaumarchaeota archaeon]|nr:type II secretion system F family protein [Nitrososphaerota archaeon]